LGDTGNVAARLQALTKERKCAMIVAQETAVLAGLQTPDLRRADLQIRGIDTDIPAFLIEQSEQLTIAQSDLTALARKQQRTNNRAIRSDRPIE
jgi:class 3 adenylate cyclase